MDNFPDGLILDYFLIEQMLYYLVIFIPVAIYNSFVLSGFVEQGTAD